MAGAAIPELLPWGELVYAAPGLDAEARGRVARGSGALGVRMLGSQSGEGGDWPRPLGPRDLTDSSFGARVALEGRLVGAKGWAALPLGNP